MIDLIFRIIMVPFLFGLAGGALIFPLLPIVLFTQPSVENFFVVLFVLGMYPVLLSYLHGALFIEHFVTRKLSKTFVDDNGMIMDPHYLKLSLRAGAYLSKALLERGPMLDTETLSRGRALLKRHRAITRFVLPGFCICGIAMVGMVLIKELGLA